MIDHSSRPASQDHRIVLKLIDFAHSRWRSEDGPDQGAIQGLQCLIDMMQRYIQMTSSEASHLLQTLHSPCQ